MTSIQNILQDLITSCGRELFETDLTPSQIQLQQTRKEFEGEITLVVFPLVKASRKSPEDTAKLIGDYLVQHSEWISRYNVVKGFLNLVVTDAYWISFFRSLPADDQFGLAGAGSKARVMVEYSSPNTNKPLHLGHLRNIFLGASVSNLLQANGHAVTRVQIINDRGIHICKSMVAWMKSGGNETPESSGLKGDKLVGKYYVEFDRIYKSEIAELIASGKSEEEAKANAPVMQEAQELLRKWEGRDPDTRALWRRMNQWVYDGFETTYKSMGVEFDKLYYESETYLLGRDEVMKGLEKGIFYQKDDGSIWVDLTEEGMDEKALLRKDGTAMYITQDIGTAILRFRDFPDTSYQIYTVGNEQEYHFKVLFRILKKLGWEQADKCYHLSYGMVELPEGKMKSREGTVVDADDLMAEMVNVAREVAAEQGKLEGLEDREKEELYHTIGMAALKYYLLRVDPVKTMVFNPRESIDFNGHTGPFIQYGYVRTRAILRKNATEAGTTFPAVSELHPAEKSILIRLHGFPAVLHESCERYNPSILANYCYELVREFNSFYHECPVLREPDEARRAFRILLSDTTGRVVKKGMSLLGIDMPERM